MYIPNRITKFAQVNLEVGNASFILLAQPLYHLKLATATGTETACTVPVVSTADIAVPFYIRFFPDENIFAFKNVGHCWFGFHIILDKLFMLENRRRIYGETGAWDDLEVPGGFERS